jgi:periplasmic divalent cation tolerance protein
MEAMFVYTTTASRDEALKIAHALIAERLAACANIVPGVTSVFRWEGSVQEETEVAVILKTRAGQVDPLIERIRALHSYTCPCIVVLPIAAGNPAFLEWIERETA